MRATWCCVKLTKQTNWRSYLVDSGYSERLQQNCSQLVNTNWGSNGWNAAAAQAVRRPFVGKEFVFLKPKEGKYDHTVSPRLCQSSHSTQLLISQQLVPVCLHAMGAIKVDVVTHLGAQQDLAGADYILVEDRDTKRTLPTWVTKSERTGNIQWLKQCLVRTLITAWYELLSDGP